MVKNSEHLRILFDASRQTSSRNIHNLSMNVSFFPVDLCTDLLYTVYSDNESPMVRIVATWLEKGCKCCVNYVDYQT